MRNEEILSMLASTVGKPLRTDAFTTSGEKLSYARVLIEIYAANELKSEVWIKGPRGSRFYQKIEYEWVPLRCKHCQRFGHLENKCPLPRLRMDEKDDEDDRVIIETELAGKVVVSKVNANQKGDRMQNVNDVGDGSSGEVGFSQNSIVPETGHTKKISMKQR
ncbi:hypothetical protein QQ045_011682 [Rhodiola kirilowii]